MYYVNKPLDADTFRDMMNIDEFFLQNLINRITKIDWTSEGNMDTLKRE